MSAAARARRELIRAGFGAELSAAASPPGRICGSTAEEQCAHLAEIASYIGETDAMMIGAAWLLERSGHGASARRPLPARRTLNEIAAVRRATPPDPGTAPPCVGAAIARRPTAGTG